MEDEKERPSLDFEATPAVQEEDCDEVSTPALAPKPRRPITGSGVFAKLIPPSVSFSHNKDLDMSQSGHLTWLVKIPKFLSERWQQQAQQGGTGVELGTMRVYDEDGSGGPRKIELILEDAAGLAPVPKTYKLDVRNSASMNLYVFDELAKPEPVASTSKPEPAGSSSTSRFDIPRRVRPKVARRPKLSGVIAHECQVSPVLDDNYRAVMRARQQKASQPKRTIKRVTQDIGTLNRMASGVTTHAQASKFAAFTRSVAKSHGREKFTRMPRTELMDVLFASFLRYDYWATKSLREQTKQPEAYLKEILTEIATLVKAGPYLGHWVLKPEYAQLNRSKAAAKFAEDAAVGKAEAEDGPSNMDEDEDDVFGADDDDDDDDDDADLDMEEVC